MKKLLIVFLTLILLMGLTVIVSEAVSLSTCWQLDSYPDSIKVDTTILNIITGSKVITGNWVVYVDPGAQPTAVIMVGTSQKVLPNNRDAGEIDKQMMLTGTVFSPDFGCDNTYGCARTKRCGLSMRFNNLQLSSGSIDGWCSYFDNAQQDTVTAQDEFHDTFHNVPCSSVPNP
jgi:hypothetical protein